MLRRDPFQAISDPTRRHIIELLQQEDLNINSITDHLNISRPAVSKHLHLLEACGVIEIIPIGKERICKVRNEALKEITAWIKGLSPKSSKAKSKKDKKKKSKK
jgi:DNA-binding transcriptional ArsR family regulator